MKMPFEGGFRVTSPYGWRANPFDGDADWHAGIDLVGEDWLVRAAQGGSCVRSRMVTDPSDRTAEWGNYVCILGDDGRYYYYCHLASRAAVQGQRIEAGQVIGVEGATGKVTGRHLHFEVREPDNRSTVNPAEVLGIPNEAGYEFEPEPDYVEQASEWAREAVRWAVERGIVNGRGDGDYAWREPVTREEVVVMLFRAISI